MRKPNEQQTTQRHILNLISSRESPFSRGKKKPKEHRSLILATGERITVTNERGKFCRSLLLGMEGKRINRLGVGARDGKTDRNTISQHELGVAASPSLHRIVVVVFSVAHAEP